MAQQYTKLMRTIWQDPEFIDLPFDSKMVYLMIISQPDINPCGVLGLRLNRWASLFPDRTAKQIGKALGPLVDARFLVIDEATEEVMARTFIRHDGGWRQTNGMASIDNGKRGVLSQQLRQLIDEVVATLDPKAKPPVPPTPPATVDGTVEPTVPSRASLEPVNRNLEPNSSSSTAAVRLASAPAEAEEDEESFQKTTVFPAGAVADEYARIALEQGGDGIKMPGAFKKSKRDEAIANPDLYRWLKEYPDATANQIACWLHGDKHSMRGYERRTS